MHPTLPVWFEIGSMVVLVLILLFDLLYVVKRPHIPSMREATAWVVFYVGLALIFALLMLWFAGGDFAGQFLAGWLTEYSLSIDNLFVFIVIMTTMSVPRKYQQEVLMVGIIIALILRGIFILAGAAVIERFSWIFYIFGAFLLYTAWKQAFGSGDEGEGDSKVTAFLRRRLNVSDEFDGNKLRTTIGGKRYWTPMLLVFITIGATDFLFAIDSIPAIFGITQSPFIVFTANVFALMGLRQLYFLLGGLLEKLIYLHYGIAFILGFIGVKLVLHALEVNELGFINGGQPVPVPHIDTMMSLVVIIGSMAIATVASLVVSRRRAARDGAVAGSEHSDGSSPEA